MTGFAKDIAVQPDPIRLDEALHNCCSALQSLVRVGKHDAKLLGKLASLSRQAHGGTVSLSGGPLTDDLPGPVYGDRTTAHYTFASMVKGYVGFARNYAIALALAAFSDLTEIPVELTERLRNADGIAGRIEAQAATGRDPALLANQVAALREALLGKQLLALERSSEGHFGAPLLAGTLVHVIGDTLDKAKRHLLHLQTLITAPVDQDGTLARMMKDRPSTRSITTTTIAPGNPESGTLELRMKSLGIKRTWFPELSKPLTVRRIIE